MAKAAAEADHWWQGDPDEFRRVVTKAAATRPAGDWRTQNVFFDPLESPPADANDRWAGALHVRSFYVDGVGKHAAAFEAWAAAGVEEAGSPANRTDRKSVV